MSLNKIKAGTNMYQDACTHTHNPLIGHCLINCVYCSTQKFFYATLMERYTGSLRIDYHALKDKLGQDKFIFACSQNDLFQPDVSNEMIIEILNYYNNYPFNTYLFQTKNPLRVLEFYHLLPINVFIATTVETNRYMPTVSKAVPQWMRINQMKDLAALNIRCILTIEPILDFDRIEFIKLIKGVLWKQINIGANSYNKVKLPEPDIDKLTTFIDDLKFIYGEDKIKIKSNLKRLL